MDTTHISFIQSLQLGGEQAWQQMNRVYRPLTISWLQRYELQASDAEDVAQEVLTVVARKIGDFEHCGHIGAFRNWLKKITVFAARDYLKKKKRRPELSGDSVFQKMLDQLQDPSSEISRQFDLEHDRYVFQALLDNVAQQFSETALAAFRLHALEGVDVEETAARLGISRRSVYRAKSHVLNSLRQQAEDWIGDITFS